MNDKNCRVVQRSLIIVIEANSITHGTENREREAESKELRAKILELLSTITPQMIVIPVAVSLLP